MTIDYIPIAEEFTIECDICGETESYQGPWKKCFAQSRLNGWRAKKKKEEIWYHACSKECYSKI